MESHGAKVVLAFDQVVKNLDNIEVLKQLAASLEQTHSLLPLTAEHHVIVREALLQTFKMGLGEGFTYELQEIFIKIYNCVRDTWHGYAVDNQQLDEDQELNILRKRIVQHSWKQCETFTHSVVAKTLFKHIFDIAPDALQLFPFKDEPNPLESEKFAEHGAKVIGILG